MQAAVIENGIVVNVVELNSLDELPGSVVIQEGFWIGDSYDGTTFSKPTPTIAQLPETVYIDAVQKKLDSVAQSYGYDSIISLVSYATSTNPVYGPQGIAGRDWRDACWAYGYNILQGVKAGTQVIPTIEEFLANLPVIKWPS